MRISSTANFNNLDSAQRAAVMSWANSHDWGASAPLWTASGLIVSVATFSRDGGEGVETYCATSMRDLRAWAGY